MIEIHFVLSFKPQNAMVPQPTVDIGACVSDTCSATDIKVILKAGKMYI